MRDIKKSCLCTYCHMFFDHTCFILNRKKISPKCYNLSTCFYMSVISESLIPSLTPPSLKPYLPQISFTVHASSAFVSKGVRNRHLDEFCDGLHIFFFQTSRRHCRCSRRISLVTNGLAGSFGTAIFIHGDIDFIQLVLQFFSCDIHILHIY